MTQEVLALFGGTPVRQEAYPDWPVHDERDIEAVSEVIRSGRWGGYPYPGPKTRIFAEQFAEMQGGGYAVPMVNGTVTMEVACRVLGIGWGDEVIVPAYTFMATAAAPMAAGAIPVIVDIDPERYTISPAAIEAAITEKTRAIIPVHLGAQIADMDAIMTIARRHNLVVIEDCAHAHGAKWRGEGVGTIGDFGSFSLQSSKILSVGEGGVLLCRKKELAQKAASIIDCGRSHTGSGFSEEGNDFQMGSNYRLTELQAALGIEALERFPEQMATRERLITYAECVLRDVPGVRLLKRDTRHTRRSFYRFIFAIDPQIFGADHRLVCKALEAEGIPCWEGYEAMQNYELFQPQHSHLPVPRVFPGYFDFEKLQLPHAARACEQEAVWLDEKIFRSDEAGLDDVARALHKILSNGRELAKCAD